MGGSGANRCGAVLDRTDLVLAACWCMDTDD